jgi:hypothetical protein
VPVECRAGAGCNYVLYNGHVYRTLMGSPPTPRPRGRTLQYYPLPEGYEVAPNDADTLAVIGAHGWDTACVIVADGTAWNSNSGAAPTQCGSGYPWDDDQLRTCEAGTVTTGRDRDGRTENFISLVGQSCPAADTVTYAPVGSYYSRVLARCG